jgi:ATP-dependent Clp protease ATP-binding subunit ClpB
MRAAVKEALQARFLPEFLNRIDETIIFHPLGREHLGRIVDLQVKRLDKQLAQRDISLVVTEAAREAIATEGYDPTYGARPLKRVIQQRIQNPLATELLKGSFVEGGHITVDYRDGEFVFSSQRPETVIETVA